MINDSEAAFEARDIACTNHRKSLPKTLQDECHYFFWASEYNLAHGMTTAAQFNVRDRRLARDYFKIEKDIGKWCPPLATHCERILKADRDKRIALIRERRYAASEAVSETVLRLKLNMQGGDVIPFPAERRAVAQQATAKKTASA
jgi:hypothetical protein